MQLTVVVPIGNVAPEAGTHVIVGLASQASDAEALNVTVAPAALVHAVEMLLGHVIVGTVVSAALKCSVRMPLSAASLQRLASIRYVVPAVALNVTPDCSVPEHAAEPPSSLHATSVHGGPHGAV